MKKLNVFIISQEEPFYIPKVIKYLLEHQDANFKVVGASRLKPHRKNKTMKDWLLERTQIYTYWELFITTIFFVYCKVWYKLLSKFGIENPFSVSEVYKKFNIKEVVTDNINSEAYLDKLDELNLDIILSISPPQLFQERLIKLPKVACLNAHGTLLPRHRGVFGSWWMLNLDDEEIGTTIHTMEERLDAGEIVWQKSIPMPKNATQYRIAYHTKKVMSEGLVEVINNYSLNKVIAIKPKYKESYHRAPTKAEGKIFHKKGKRVVTLSDAKYTLACKFE
jgi:methionyl-tRNA formyltransferase